MSTAPRLKSMVSKYRKTWIWSRQSLKSGISALLLVCGCLSGNALAEPVSKPLSKPFLKPFSKQSTANQSTPVKPTIAIIIDDLGNLKDRDERALRLPGAITYAFLPHTPHAYELALQAHSRNKEIMLHLPMESMEHNKLGPGGLTLDMTQSEFARQLQSALASVPHVIGVNNHMGSLLTQHPGHMLWLMQELGKHDNLYFVDSYTTKTSIAQQIAMENQVPNIRRDVFLDNNRDPASIKKHFQRLIKKAKKNGAALGIGHPYPETIAILEAELPKLAKKGITLLPVSKLLNRSRQKEPQRPQAWQASLSH